MYVYIYDDLVVKNEGVLHKIERRLTDLGLNGEIIKPEVSKDIKTSLEDKIKRGAKTIVAVGANENISNVINIVANSQSERQQELTLGIIPLDKKDPIFKDSFGVNNIDEACDILLARKLEKIDLAGINDSFFLFKAKIENIEKTIFEIDEKYTAQSLFSGVAEIKNGSLDKKLKLSINNKWGRSHFPAQKIIIAGKEKQIILDNSLKIDLPAAIKPNKKTIKVIVGKNRDL